MKTYNQLITEIFDSKLSLTRDLDMEEKIKKTFYPHTLTNIESYTTKHENIPYIFQRFKHKGMWEVHFGRADTDDENEKIAYSISHPHAHKLISTAISLYKEKLDKGQPVRYYGVDSSLNNLYDKTFEHISKKYDNLYSRDVKNFEGPDKRIHNFAREISTRDLNGDKLGLKESTFKKI